MCEKRRYDSLKAIRQAHRRAGWRTRGYLCHVCNGWHVTNGEKAERRGRDFAEARRRRWSGPTLGLAPTRSLAELEQIAAGMRRAG